MPTASLYEKARRYHAAVRRLRDGIEQRVARLLAVPDDGFALPDVHTRRSEPIAPRAATERRPAGP